jgi:hypothetical protein
MDVTAEFTGGCTDAPTAMLDGLTQAPTTRVLPPIPTVLPRTTTALALTTVLLRITVVRAFTLALGEVGGEVASVKAGVWLVKLQTHREEPLARLMSCPSGALI